MSRLRYLEALRWIYRLQALLRWRNADVKAMERERARFYDWMWRSACAQLGGSAESLGDDLLRLKIGVTETRVWANFTPIDDPVTLLVARNKPVAYRLLSEAHLPIPRHLPFSLASLDKAAHFLERLEKSCVVKPARDTGGGLGVTTGIIRQRELLRAAAFASGYCRDLVIEEHVAGNCYRLLYLDGVLLDAIVRHPPSVRGDGRSTIGELVQRENLRRLKTGFRACQFLLRIDGDMRGTLAKQGLSLRSVPALDAQVVVKNVVNENAAEENETVTDRLCKEVIASGSHAAAAVGVRLAGVDMMTTDPILPLEESGGRIMEVNATPGLYYHYFKADRPVSVAETVLAALCANDSPPPSEHILSIRGFRQVSCASQP